MFEKIKRKSKTSYFSKRLKDVQGCAKKTWYIMKEVAGKIKLKHKSLPDRININNEKFKNRKIVAEKFNNFFINIGPKLAKKIPSGAKDYISYIIPPDTVFVNVKLTLAEFDKALSSLKTNKAAGYDQISSNTVLQCMEHIKPALFHICKLSIEKEHSLISLRLLE